MLINFFSEQINFNLHEEEQIRIWINKMAETHDKNITTINYIFCSDKYLLKINQKYLNHDDYTDIITFNNSDNLNEIEGDIFISVERVKDNAHKAQQNFNDELHRVIIHGLLHLIGFNDSNKEERKIIRKKEDNCLFLLNKQF